MSLRQWLAFVVINMSLIEMVYSNQEFSSSAVITDRNDAASSLQDVPEAGDPANPRYLFSGRVIGADGQPAAGCTIRVLGVKPEPITTEFRTDQTGSFCLALRLSDFSISSTSLFFLDETAQHGLIHIIKFDGSSPLTEGLEITLVPMQDLPITVVDQQASSVPDSQVVVTLKNFGSAIYSLTKSDQTGRTIVRLPGSEAVYSIAAWNDEAGFDYRIFGRSRFPERSLNTTPETIEFAKGVQLVLSGTKPLTVQVVDDHNQPIPGAKVLPWFLQRPDQMDIFNLSSISDQVQMVSDADGRVHFPWFPNWQKESVTIWANHPEFNRPRTMYLPGPKNGEVIARLERTLVLSGRVLDSNGLPVAGIMVKASGKKTHEQRPEDKTDADGRFSFRVLPGQECLVAVVDERWGAETHLIAIESAERPIDNVEFQLVPTTRVSGTLRNVTTNKPVSSDRGSVFYLGSHVDGFRTGQRKEAWPLNRPTIHLSGNTKPDGTFEFQLGPGDYMYRPGDDDEMLYFTVAGNEPLELDPKTIKGAMTRLEGTAVSAKDHRPVAGAKVLVIMDKFQGDRWEAVTDTEGNFSLPVREEPAAVQIVSPDHNLVVIESFEPSGEPITFELEPSGSIRGRVVDRRGKPVVGTRVEINEWNNSGGYAGRFANFTTTDDEGRFELKGLAPGCEYQFNRSFAETNLPNGWFLVGSGELFDVGDVRHVPPRAVGQ